MIFRLYISSQGQNLTENWLHSTGFMFLLELIVHLVIYYAFFVEMSIGALINLWIVLVFANHSPHDDAILICAKTFRTCQDMDFLCKKKYVGKVILIVFVHNCSHDLRMRANWKQGTNYTCLPKMYKCKNCINYYHFCQGNQKIMLLHVRKYFRKI